MKKTYIFKTVVSVLLAFTVVLLATSCKLEATASQALQNALLAVQRDEKESVEQNFGVERIWKPVVSNVEELKWLDDSDIYKAVASNFTFTLGKEKQNGPLASVELTVQTKDLRSTIERSLQDYTKQQRENPTSTTTASELFENNLKSDVYPYIEKHITATLTQYADEKTWRISNADELIALLTDGLTSKDGQKIGSHEIYDERGLYMKNVENIYRLWYNEPAQDSREGWENSGLPIGNGHMGAVVFGGVGKERIQFNEKTLWSGGPTVAGSTGGNPNNTNGEALGRIQKLLESGKKKDVMKEMDNLLGDEIGKGSYQNFGEIYLTFGSDKAENYTRGLNLTSATADVEYTQDGAHVKRTYFMSYPDNVLVVKLESDKENSLTFDVEMSSAQDGTVSAEGNTITMAGTVQEIVDGKIGKNANDLKYASNLQVVADGGSVAPKGGGLSVSNANSVTLYMSAATNYKNEYPVYRSTAVPSDVAKGHVEKAIAKGYDAVREDHKKDYEPIFSRLNLDLGQGVSTKPTNTLLKEYRAGRASTELEMLYFQYGRYLLVASSREGTLPANLQGVWNDQNNPAWESDYHLNVNLQMNYWHTYSANLTEMALPLIEYVNSLREPGRITSKYYVGIGELTQDGKVDTSKATGWMAHTQNNPMGNTGPGSEWNWGWSPTAGAWLMQNTYDYYRFTKDIDTLEKDIYPAMEESALMWSQMLVEEKDTGRLVSSPTYSPEHGPISIGNTYDQSLIWELYKMTIEAAKDLIDSGRGNAVDETLIVLLEEQMPRLKPISVGKWGQIKEWQDEDKWMLRGRYTQNVEKGHRHFSHLLGLYPGTLINKETDEWLEAAQVSLDDRGNKGTGWSKAQKICAWARAGDGNRSYLMLAGILTDSTLDNLWDTHPPYQIDGNFGATAGVLEMFVQSHIDYIDLLPALPDAWENGSVKGIKARGGFELDFVYKDKEVQSLTLKSTAGVKARIGGMKISKITTDSGEEVKFVKNSDGIVSFDTVAGRTYTII